MQSIRVKLLAFFSAPLISFPTFAVTNWVNFDIINGHITLPVTINGIEGRAILDSGSQLNAINLSFINKYNLEFEKGRKIDVKGIYSTESLSL